MMDGVTRANRQRMCLAEIRAESDSVRFGRPKHQCALCVLGPRQRRLRVYLVIQHYKEHLYIIIYIYIYYIHIYFLYHIIS